MWQNKKYKGRIYKGTYSWASGERTFVLVCLGVPKNAKVSFESHEMAKRNGWVKLNG